MVSLFLALNVVVENFLIKGQLPAIILIRVRQLSLSTKTCTLKRLFCAGKYYSGRIISPADI
jgi:hypothetical protein